MRLCRFEHEGRAQVGFYSEDFIWPLNRTMIENAEHTFSEPALLEDPDLVSFLPPAGRLFEAAKILRTWLEGHKEPASRIALRTDSVKLLAPFPRPNKLLLLAGNYAAHVEEGGEMAVERAETFPYVFMKPVTTTVNHPEAPVPIPAISPDHIDWEAELAVVIGKTAKDVSEAEALNYVAGYTVINDVSDRNFTPNPGRKLRERDGFFDWLHGKWHDGFCPMGPCVISADAVPNPQNLHITLKVNGEIKQDASTALQIYPVAAVIAFISSWITLEPGDIISTGTPSGVGMASGTYLKPGDVVEAAIDGIGVLRNPMVAG